MIALSLRYHRSLFKTNYQRWSWGWVSFRLSQPAGNTSRLGSGKHGLPVHPRVCGEHNHTGTFMLVEVGSSPRLRGTSPRPPYPLHHPRFIPASAGNMFRPKSHRAMRSVHLRVCGEHLCSICERLIIVGSSPRLRGTLQGQQLNYMGNRFIPASAGNIDATGPTWYQGTVHPRVCGEHILTRYCPDAPFGSSPRLRGTFYGQVRGSLFYRFIPASAGNMCGRKSRP